VISLHQIVRPDHDFFINPDMILLVEANPDTVVTLTNGTRFVVAETPGEVASRVADWRAGILTRALTAPIVANHPRVGEALGQVLHMPPHAHQAR
jgi:flagellar protein FlbD